MVRYDSKTVPEDIFITKLRAFSPELNRTFIWIYEI